MSVRVLVVDDNVWVRGGLNFMLTHVGMDVVEVRTCCDAIRVAEQSDFDVVLLDIRLTDGDGFDLLAHIKAKQPDLPVLIYTFHDRQSYVARSHALGASGYLVKGLDNHTLLEAILSVLNGESVWTSTQLVVAKRMQTNFDTSPVS